MNLLEEWRELVTNSLKKHQEIIFTDKSREGADIHSLYLNSTNSLEIPFSKRPFYNIFPAVGRGALGASLQDTVFAFSYNQFEELGKFPEHKKLFINSSLWRSEKSLTQLENLLDTVEEVSLEWGVWARGLHSGQLHREDGLQDLVEKSSLLTSDKVKAFRLSSEIYHLAGAHHVQELAILLSSAVESLRCFPEQLETIVAHTHFEFPMSVNPFENIAKLQAMRLLWAKLQKTLGVVPQEALMFARPSLRYLSSREPWNNLMRMTLMNFAAQVGGAQGFFHEPYDVYSNEKKDDGHLARNISLILDQESKLLEFSLPALGSGYIDSLTEQYCEKSWSLFQEIQNKGGLVESLLSGWLQKEIAVSHEHETKALFSGEKKMLGVNCFVGQASMSEEYSLVRDVLSISDVWSSRVGTLEPEKVHEVKPLRLHQLSENFEQWQRRSDLFLDKFGNRPKVSFFCQERKAFQDRLRWLKEFLLSAGIESESVNEEENVCSDIVFCFGYEPEEKLWNDRLQLWKEKSVKKVFWFGEKSHNLFPEIINKKTPPLDFYEKVYKVLEGEA